MQPITNTHKVLMNLEINPIPSSKKVPAAVEYEFIYGIGTYGICPFEKALGSKAVGDTAKITINAGDWGELFGHLTPPELQIFPETEQLEITAKVIAVAPAENREVIQALANSTACGGGCGCGCGGH